MRKDIAKKLCERPRHGNDHGINNRKHRRKAKSRDEDHLNSLPRKEAIKAPHRWDRKELSENFAPVMRFLEKRVNRPWNKVHQEISEHVDYSSATMKHIADHVFKDFVEQHASFDEDGHPYTYKWGGRHRYYLSPGKFFVDSKGFLRQVPRKKRKRRVTYGVVPDPHKDINDFESFRKIDKVWYWVRYKHITKGQAARDVILHKTILIDSNYSAQESECVESNGYPREHGNPVYRRYGEPPVVRVCVERRQLSRRNIVRNGLDKL